MQYENFVSPNVSVDSVIFQLIGNGLSVLLIKRAEEPFKGVWALPGGYNPAGEKSYDAMSRSLESKTGILIKKLEFLEQLYTFDDINRDPRGHTISVTYMGLARNLVPVASKTTENPQFFPVDDLPKLAYDHQQIIDLARERLSAKILYSNIIFAFLPRMFTLTRLQDAYEAILGEKLDKRNFRKKFLSLDLIEPTSEYHMKGAHRPAKLYRFNNHQIEYLSRSFDETL